MTARITQPVRFVVRRASAADIERVAPLFDAYRRFYGAWTDVEGAREFLEMRLARDESVVLVAHHEPEPRAGEGDVVGFAQLFPSFSSLALAPTIILNDLFVAPAWRGLGAARRLIEETAALARSVGAVRVELATQHTNERARRLYLALGYVPDTEFVHMSLELAEG